MERYCKLSVDVVRTIFVLSGIDLSAMNVYKEKEQEVVDMCQAWDDHKERGRKEGIEQGIEQTLLLMVSKKVQKNMTLNMIADHLEEDVDVIRPIYEKVIREYQN